MAIFLNKQYTNKTGVSLKFLQSIISYSIYYLISTIDANKYKSMALAYNRLTLGDGLG